GDDDLIVGTAQGPMALVLLGAPGENTWEPIEYLDLDGQECTNCLWEHNPPIRVLLDANGDGLTDYFTTGRRSRSTDHSDATRIWLNTGRGFRAEHYPV